MYAFLGSEAIASRAVSRGELRSRYTRVLPNVYVHKGLELTLEDRAHAAWVWCGQSGVIAGRTAAGLYLDTWAVTAEPVELIALKSRHPPGLIVRNERKIGEPTSEFQSLMRISDAVFCLQKKQTQHI